MTKERIKNLLLSITNQLQRRKGEKAIANQMVVEVKDFKDFKDLKSS